jgi:hypothetical protein
MMQLLSDTLNNKYNPPLRVMVATSDVRKQTQRIQTPLISVKIEGYLRDNDAELVITRSHHIKPTIVMDLAEARALVSLLAEIEKAWELEPNSPILELCKVKHCQAHCGETED